MWPLPKKYFEWREPAGFRKVQAATAAASRTVLTRLGTGMLGFAAGLALWAAAHISSTNQPPPFAVAAGLAVLMGLLLAYVVPWLNSALPTRVMVLDHHLSRTNGHQHSSVRFDQVATFRILPADGFHVLALERRKGSCIHVGLPAAVDVDALSAFLEERGVPRDRTTSAQWPESMGDQSIRPNANVGPCH